MSDEMQVVAPEGLKACPFLPPIPEVKSRLLSGSMQPQLTGKLILPPCLGEGCALHLQSEGESGTCSISALAADASYICCLIEEGAEKVKDSGLLDKLKRAASNPLISRFLGD
jgi:hypothetical protein